MAYLEPCVTCIFRILPYSESWHILNLRYIRNSVKAYSDIFRTLCNARISKTLTYSELGHIQNFSIFRTPDIQNTVYIGTFRLIQAYSIMIVTITFFFFFYLNLSTFQRILKRRMHFHYNDVSFNARLSVLK